MRSFVAALLLVLFAGPVEAKGHHSGLHRHHAAHHAAKAHRSHVSRHRSHARAGRRAGSAGYGARPGAWCGWWMRGHLGISDPSLNLARNWARVGQHASGPGPGIIGVMAHHVFQVISVISPGRVLAISGNDGHAVRTRVRSTGGVFAWRHV